MAFSVGKSAACYVNGVDLTPYLNQEEVDLTQDAVDVTTFGNQAKVYINGQQNQTLNVSGFYDPGAGASEQTLRNIIGTVSIWTALPVGDVAGNRGQGLVGIETDYKHSAPVGGALAITASVQGTVGAEPVVVIAAKQQIGAGVAGTTNTTGYDYGTALSGSGGTVTVGGLSSYLQVFAGSGASTVTVNVQHGTALAGTYATLATHTTFVCNTAPTSERIVVAPGVTINEFIRTQVIIGGAGTVTLNNSVARDT